MVCVLAVCVHHGVHARASGFVGDLDGSTAGFSIGLVSYFSLMSGYGQLADFYPVGTSILSSFKPIIVGPRVACGLACYSYASIATHRHGAGCTRCVVLLFPFALLVGTLPAPML